MYWFYLWIRLPPVKHEHMLITFHLLPVLSANARQVFLEYVWERGERIGWSWLGEALDVIFRGRACPTGSDEPWCFGPVQDCWELWCLRIWWKRGLQGTHEWSWRMPSQSETARKGRGMEANSYHLTNLGTHLNVGIERKTRNWGCKTGWLGDWQKSLTKMGSIWVASFLWLWGLRTIFNDFGLSEKPKRKI